MGDWLSWIWDLTVWLAHGFGGDGVPIGGVILAALWLLAVLLVVLGVGSALVALGRAFARGWQTAGRRPPQR